jgi:hypothetical protein
MSAPTPMDIARRMETALPSERRAALHACARDVGELWRLRRLSRRARDEWANALMLWGVRRAGLTWAQTSREIIAGLKENEGGQ